jgi:hypothetical protein
MIDGKPFIFVNGKPFNHCMFLAVTITTEEASGIDSINELIDIQDSRKMEGATGREFGLDDDQILQAHASNLQAWVENDYDTRLLHHNLSFPLLKELARSMDKKAIEVLKYEMMERLKSQHEGVMITLIDCCSEFFGKNEYNEILKTCNMKVLRTLYFDDDTPRWVKKIVETRSDIGILTTIYAEIKKWIGDNVNEMIYHTCIMDKQIISFIYRDKENPTDRWKYNVTIYIERSDINNFLVNILHQYSYVISGMIPAHIPKKVYEIEESIEESLKYGIENDIFNIDKITTDEIVSRQVNVDIYIYKTFFIYRENLERDIIPVLKDNISKINNDLIMHGKWNVEDFIDKFARKNGYTVT